ncbi:MAG: class I SAM-dependent methyltransferase [Actinomycetota bacterium]
MSRLERPEAHSVPSRFVRTARWHVRRTRNWFAQRFLGLPRIRTLPDFPERVLRVHRGWIDGRRQQAILSYSWSGRVLDVGCGRGYVSSLVAAAHSPSLIVGLEPSFKLARTSLSLAALNRATRFLPVQGTGSVIPFSSRSFDWILVSEVLEHTYEPLDILKECARVLRPAGRALLTVPSYGALPPGGPVAGHVQDFQPAAFIDLVKKAGLQVVQRRTVAIFEFYLLTQAQGPRSPLSVA